MPNADNLQSLRQHCAQRLRDKLLDPSLRAQKAATVPCDAFLEETQSRSFAPELFLNTRLTASVPRRHPEVPPLPLQAKNLTQERAHSASIPRRTPVTQAVQVRPRSTGRGYDRPTASSLAAGRGGQKESPGIIRERIPERFPSNFWGNGIPVRESTRACSSPVQDSRSSSPSRCRVGNPPEPSRWQGRQSTSQPKLQSTVPSPKSRAIRQVATSLPRTMSPSRAATEHGPSQRGNRIQSHSPPPRKVGSAPHPVVRVEERRIAAATSSTNSKRPAVGYAPVNLKAAVNRLHQKSTLASEAGNVFQNGGNHPGGSQGNFVLEDEQSIDSISMASTSTLANKMLSPSVSALQNLIDENSTLREAFMDANRRLKQLEEEKSSFFTEGVFELANSVALGSGARTTGTQSFDADTTSQQIISSLRRVTIDSNIDTMEVDDACSSSPRSRFQSQGEKEMAMGITRSLSNAVDSVKVSESRERTVLLSSENTELRQELQSASELREVLEQQQRLAEDRMHKLEEERAWLAQRLAHCVAVVDAGDASTAAPLLGNGNHRSHRNSTFVNPLGAERIENGENGVHESTNSNVFLDLDTGSVTDAAVFQNVTQRDSRVLAPGSVENLHDVANETADMGKSELQTDGVPDVNQDGMSSADPTVLRSSLEPSDATENKDPVATRISRVSTTKLLDDIDQRLEEVEQTEVSPHSAAGNTLPMIDIEDAW